jgi:multidrug transporter EmrE-like cation transporter
MTITIIIIIFLSINDFFLFYFVKKYRVTNNKIFFILAIFLAIVMVYLLSYTLKINKMAIVNSLWNAASMFYVTLLGYFVFKEKISSKETVAIVLITIGTLLIIKK